MKNKDFVQLHNHTHFSVLDGMGTAEEYARRSADLGFKYLGCTDHGTVDGLIDFQRQCLKHGVKPILGCEGYIVPDAIVKQREKRGHITFLVKNQQGWINLCRMLYRANQEGHHYRPRMDYGQVLRYHEGLVIMSACALSFLTIPGGVDFLEDLIDAGADFYFEAMPFCKKWQRVINEKVEDLADEMDIPIVATTDAHFVLKEDAESHEVLLAIQTKKTWDDPKRWRFHASHLKTADEMFHEFHEQGIFSGKEISAMIKKTVEVAEKCEDFQLEKMKVVLPKVPSLDFRKDENKILWDLTQEGLVKLGKQGDRKYRMRRTTELSVIFKMDYSRYFLIVWDFVNYCHKNKIAVGPGRGSAAGSLVLYLIGITAIDPIKHGLIFERFLTEERIDNPDIDLDIEDRKRTIARAYVEATYGKENVTSVSTFGRMKGRAAFKDVCRVFGIKPAEANRLSNCIRNASQGEYNADTIEEAIETNPVFSQWADDHERVIKHSKNLEGKIRQASQHASALIISSGDVIEQGRAVIVQRSGKLVANWDGPDCEMRGLMKLDYLGLNNMTIISETMRLIKENHGEEIDLRKISLKDADALKVIDNGRVEGLFQVSGWATRKVLEQTGCTRFEDIAAAVALSRPGPKDSGMTDEYIERKRTGKWKKLHPIYEKVNEETYGAVVYQEQVMGVIKEVAGLPYTTADKIRKVIGKKRSAKEFKPFHKAFIEGCEKQKTLTKKQAEHFWDQLQKHAKYSFNKAHSVSYAYIAYWEAWLKAHYPEEFICAILTYGKDHVKEDIIEEAIELGLKIRPPKIGKSDMREWRIIGDEIYIPFCALKNVGDATLRDIEQLRPSKKGMRSLFGEDDRPYYVTTELKESTRKILDACCSLDEHECPPLFEIKDLFKFSFSDDVISNGDGSLESAVIIRKKYPVDRKLIHCTECALRRECRNPVLPSPGVFNAIICGREPGENEDKFGEGFCDKDLGRRRNAAQILWRELKEYGLIRKQFHVTNVVKCYPKQSKKPKKHHIEICTKLWLEKELAFLEPEIGIFFGKVCIDYFAPHLSGESMRALSGKIIVPPKWPNLRLVACVHPAAVLYQREENYPHFNRGIRKFAELFQSVKSASGF